MGHRSAAGYELGAITTRPLKTRRVKRSTWTEQPGWPELIRALGKHLEPHGPPIALAAIRLDK